MTTYAQYFKTSFPINNAFRAREQKLIESAQCGIGDEDTLRLAIANADDNDLIVLAPTTITLTSQLVVNKPLRFKGSSAAGVKGTLITGSATIASSLISVQLTAFSAASEVSFENINFAQADDDLDVIDVNNTNASSATLTVRFTDCNIAVFDASADGFAVDVSHATAGSAINLIMTGRGENYSDAINFTVKNASDVLEVHGMKLRKAGKASAVITSADAVAGQVRLFNTQVPHEAGCSGGNAAQLLISVRCYSLTGTTYAAADTNDYTGTQTETIV